MEKKPNFAWTVSEIWNKALASGVDREPEPRDYLWASELGKAPIDVYLRMMGEKETNPPNIRSRRKFEAGNLFEWVVGMALKRAGVLKETQGRTKFNLQDNLLAVSGKADFIAGGMIDETEAEADLEKINTILDLPPMFHVTFKAIIKHLKESYPEGLAEKPIEVKSVSGYMFEKIEKAMRPIAIHRMQAYHYVKGYKVPQGSILYICRDDCRMLEFAIHDNKENEDEYRRHIQVLTDAYNAKERPPLEKPIVFDNDLGSFSKNFNVAYSGYLTLLYGYESQAEFDDVYAPIQQRWNRVLKRIKDEANMTENNKEVIQEMESAGYNVEELVSKMPEKKTEE